MCNDSKKESEQEIRFEPDRYRLEDERPGKTYKLTIGDLQGVQMWTGKKPPQGRGYFIKAYVNTGEYPDGALGEVFITPDKEGSFTKGVLDGFALLLSIALQHGISLEDIAAKYLNTRFEPSGFTTDESVPMASSFFDFMFRKLALEYLDEEALDRLGVKDRKKQKEKNCQEDNDGTLEDSFEIQRPTTGFSGEPFNRKKNNKEDDEKAKPEAAGEEV